MTPQRHWRSYGTDPLPTGAEALAEPFRAFPSWFLRITCDRCGKDRMVNEAHARVARPPILRDILKRMRHDGCGGGRARRSCSPASRAPAAGRCGRSRLLGVAVLAAVLGLSSASPAAATDNVHLIGAGMSSCEIWTADRTARNVDAVQDEQWVVGYLSGVAIWTPDLNPMKGVNAQAVWAWMDNYCREHPLVAIKDATSAFVEEHPGKN